MIGNPCHGVKERKKIKKVKIHKKQKATKVRKRTLHTSRIVVRPSLYTKDEERFSMAERRQRRSRAGRRGMLRSDG
jgi:hypothetical protein